MELEAWEQSLEKVNDIFNIICKSPLLNQGIVMIKSWDVGNVFYNFPTSLSEKEWDILIKMSNEKIKIIKLDTNVCILNMFLFKEKSERKTFNNIELNIVNY